MTDHPDRIWATVNGGYHRSGRSGGAWYLTGGWDEIVTREGQREYLRRDGETVQELAEALRNTSAVLQQVCRDRGIPETSEYLIGGAFRSTVGEVLNGADAVLAKIRRE